MEKENRIKDITGSLFKASAVMFRFTEGRGRDREFKFILN